LYSQLLTEESTSCLPVPLISILLRPREPEDARRRYVDVTLPARACHDENERDSSSRVAAPTDQLDRLALTVHRELPENGTNRLLNSIPTACLTGIELRRLKAPLFGTAHPPRFRGSWGPSPPLASNSRPARGCSRNRGARDRRILADSIWSRLQPTRCGVDGNQRCFI